MFCSNEYYEKPWALRQAPVSVKTEGYFHSKDDLWNSLSHTSPKQAAFFLTAHRDPIYLSSAQSMPSSPSVVPQRTLASQQNLMRRTLERELLQLKSNQRVLLSGPSSPPDADHKSRFTDYLDPARGPTNLHSSWSRLNQHPLKSVKLTVTPEVLERDRMAINAVQAAFARDAREAESRHEWLTQNRKKLHNTLSFRHLENLNKEKKAGVKKEKLGTVRATATVSSRTAELSQPHQPQQRHLHSEFSGLILADYVPAARKAYRVSSDLPTAQHRSHSRLFPLPERLGTGSRSVLSSRKGSGERPVTVKTQSILILPKPKDTIGDEMMSRAEVMESLKDIEDFNARVHQEATVAFSKIHFSTFKDPKPR